MQSCFVCITLTSCYGYADCGESEDLSPEIRISENILHNSNKSLGNGKDVGVIESSPASDSLKGLLILAKYLLLRTMGFLISCVCWRLAFFPCL